ncbi:hypothetical protein OG21DRAFT_1517701 [Imleria badia]|nr:hypothetical protein OG21DRAFT_1517701 [Imleria badia]
MTAPFAFVPRAVSKYTKEWQGISRPPPSPSPPPDPTTDSDDEHTEPAHRKHSTQDIASLISLALSDYNIWLDSDLRWKLDASLQDDTSPDNAAFVPINYLLRRAPFRGSLPSASTNPEPSETEALKALRTHASRTFEVRMRLPTSTSSASVWYGTGKTSRKKDVGGYEVRRRDWATLRDCSSRGWTRARWDEMTAYMECIPPQYRSVGGIARFAELLLSETNADVVVEPRLRVQCVTLPPHYLDKPGDAPKCKGYALVTFSSKSDLDAVLDAWPWERYRVHVPANANDDGNVSPVVKEAHKYALRATSKARWDALNKEYLLYKQSLVEEVARVEVEVERLGQDASDYDYDHEGGEPAALPHPPHTETQTPMQTTPFSHYPFDCLVFVRNVHPDTNKTMLKSLFAQAFQDQDQDGAASTAGLDYVDFNRGMDTCHLRLASPDHATQLIAYFDARPKTQAHGLDATGRAPLADDKPIVSERVQGKKEELYWEKVPDKVRRQAVDKVVQAQRTRGAEWSERNGASGSRQKKRTREC